MDQASAQRRVAFIVIVLALAGLGASLLWPRPSPAASGPTAHAATSAPAPAPSSPAAPASPVPSGPGVNIYQLLPFSQADLTEAAGVVRRFCTHYATHSYTESAGSYVGRMRGLITSELAAPPAPDYATPGAAHTRTPQKQPPPAGGGITPPPPFAA